MTTSYMSPRQRRSRMFLGDNELVGRWRFLDKDDNLIASSNSGVSLRKNSHRVYSPKSVSPKRFDSKSDLLDLNKDSLTEFLDSIRADNRGAVGENPVGNPTRDFVNTSSQL